jgi:hypothetical protein
MKDPPDANGGLYYGYASSCCVRRVKWMLKLGQLHLKTGFVFENGMPFYEKLGDERATALLRALWAEGYRIVPAGYVSIGSDHLASS